MKILKIEFTTILFQFFNSIFFQGGHALELPTVQGLPLTVHGDLAKQSMEHPNNTIRPSISTGGEFHRRHTDVFDIVVS